MELKSILIPYDGSDASNWILGPAHRFLGQGGGHVQLLSVIGPRDREDYGPLKAARDKLQAMVLDPEREELRVSLALERGDPTEVILTLMKRAEPDLVAMATHGRSGVSRAVMGSVAETVLRDSSCLMLLCNEHGARAASSTAPYKRILLPQDGTKDASEIVDDARELALAHGSEIVLVRVDPAFADEGSKRYDEVTAFLTHCAEMLERHGVPKVSLVGSPGDPADVILRTVEGHRIDLVAMSTHGRTGLERLRFGSVAEAVLRRCPCPLLLKRARFA